MASQRRTPEHWRRLVAGWPGSGLTQAQYCERHGISVASLHRWRERLAGDHNLSGVGAVSRETGEPLRLVPVELLGAEPLGWSGEGRLRLVFAADLHLEIAPGFDAPTLRRVVALLREPVLT